MVRFQTLLSISPCAATAWFTSDVNCTYKGFAVGVTEVNEGDAERSASGRACQILPATSRGLLSFTLELNLSNSRTHS